MKLKHPGQISYYELQEGKEILLRTKSIKEIPINMQFIETAEGMIPVVKSVMIGKGDFREIIEYGPKDKFLRSTLLTNSM